MSPREQAYRTVVNLIRDALAEGTVPAATEPAHLAELTRIAAAMQGAADAMAESTTLPEEAP